MENGQKGGERMKLGDNFRNCPEGKSNVETISAKNVRECLKSMIPFAWKQGSSNDDGHLEEVII